nr:hypothetical protein [Cressdnaviricota sp.]
MQLRLSLLWLYLAALNGIRLGTQGVIYVRTNLCLETHSGRQLLCCQRRQSLKSLLANSCITWGCKERSHRKCVIRFAILWRKFASVENTKSLVIFGLLIIIISLINQ